MSNFLPSAIFCQPNTIEQIEKNRNLRNCVSSPDSIKKHRLLVVIRPLLCFHPIFKIDKLTTKNYDWVGLVPSPPHFAKTNCGPYSSNPTISHHWFVQPWAATFQGSGRGLSDCSAHKLPNSSHGLPMTIQTSWGLGRKWTKAFSPVGQNLDRVLQADWSLALEAQPPDWSETFLSSFGAVMLMNYKKSIFLGPGQCAASLFNSLSDIVVLNENLEEHATKIGVKDKIGSQVNGIIFFVGNPIRKKHKKTQS